MGLMQQALQLWLHMGRSHLLGRSEACMRMLWQVQTLRLRITEEVGNLHCQQVGPNCCRASGSAAVSPAAQLGSV